MKVSRVRAVLAAVAVVLVAGCTDKVEGGAVEAHFWDPCTELSDEALRAVGALPETKDDSVQRVGWRMCGWKTETAPYYLNVYSAEIRIADIRANETKTDFRDITIDGRKALEYKNIGSTLGSCSVAFDTARGSVHVELTKAELKGDACPLTITAARNLMTYLPG